MVPSFTLIQIAIVPREGNVLSRHDRIPFQLNRMSRFLPILGDTLAIARPPSFPSVVLRRLDWTKTKTSRRQRRQSPRKRGRTAPLYRGRSEQDPFTITTRIGRISHIASTRDIASSGTNFTADTFANESPRVSLGL